MQLVVGRIGRPHGVRGEVSVEVRTDDPDRRYAAGSVLATVDRDGEPGPVLTVRQARPHSGRLLVDFEGVADRGAADALRGHLLVVDSTTSGGPTDDDEWWDHELIGLTVVTVSGDELGTLVDVLHVPGSDLLAVCRADGVELLVPFVSAIVPEVDVPGRRIVVDPPPGLLDMAGEVVATSDPAAVVEPGAVAGRPGD